MIYQTICTLLRWFMRFFYPRVFVLHSESIPKNRPFILVCNHNNSFMDAFVLAVQFDTPLYFVKPLHQKVHYLMKVLMASLHIVPLQKGWHRKKEGHIGSPWMHLSELLASNKPLVFFSETKNDILKVTKGAAKIAFHSEEVFDFNLDVEIVPVSIYYSKSGDAVIMLGQEVPVRSFEKDYRRYPARTIKGTTKYLEDELTNGCTTDQAEFARLLAQFQQMNKIAPEPNHTQQPAVFFNHPVTKAFHQEDPVQLKNRLKFFFDQLGQLRMKAWSPNRPGLKTILLSLLGAPVFILGYTVNWFRYQLSGSLAMILLPHMRHTDSSKMIIGLFLFPFIWIIISGVVLSIYGNPLLGLGVLLGLPLLAHFTHHYEKLSKPLIGYIKYQYCLRFRSSQARTIEQTYHEISYLLRQVSTSKVLYT